MLRHDLGDGAHLRLAERRDADELAALIAANRDHLSRWMPWAAASDLDSTKAFIDLTLAQIANDDGFQTAMVRDSRIIGMVGFHGVDWAHRSTSVGYWLAEEQQGRGTMTRAVRALVEHAFTTWELHRVEIQAATGNPRSQAIPIRLGFTREGVLRGVEKVGDRYLDHVVFGMLAPEWRAH